VRRFYVLLGGLSADSVWRQMAGDEISIVDDPDKIAGALHS
jgi:hypothetical protein